MQLRRMPAASSRLSMIDATRWRLGLLALAVLGLAACESRVAPEQVEEQLDGLRPTNIVLIVVDTLRADWTTPYGGDPHVSPEFARWAERGILFENALAQSSWTKASMASLLTSTWPQRHGVAGTTDGLGDGALSVAEVFSRAGYRTYAVQSNGWLEQTFGFHQGFDRYMFPRGGTQVANKASIWPHADNIYLEAVRLLDRHDPAEPFFLYLHFMDVHEYAAPVDVVGFGSGEEGAYRAAIAWVDEVVERFRVALDERDLLRRTVCVLASDHGEAFGENGRKGHARDLHRPVLLVPLIVRFPFATEPQRVDAQVRNLDIAPTLLDLAGLTAPSDFQGRSLLGEESRSGAPRPAFSALRARLFPDSEMQNAVDDGEWTLIRHAGDSEAEFLFDRSVDPGEHVNLIDMEPQPAARMRSLLDAHLAQPAAAGSMDAKVRINPALAEKLRALGYGT